MIVKNESKVIQRCLDSVKPFIDTWLIVDTGSEDGTQGVIRECLKDIPGELIERPWVDFSFNRTEAFRLGQAKADYSLLIDADEELRAQEDFSFPQLTADVYLVSVYYAPSYFHRELLLDNRQDWHWEGVLHEQITCSRIKQKLPIVIEILPKILNHSYTDGHRNAHPQEKYLSDAALLEAALAKDPENSRYVFYAAQSYSQADIWDRALYFYEKRSKMGGWPQEIYQSLYMIGTCQERLGMDPSLAIQSYSQAFQFRQKRAEPIARIAQNYLNQQNYALAYITAKFGLTIPIPGQESVFVEQYIYEYGLLILLIEASYRLGRVQEAVEASERVLAQKHKLPAALLALIEDSLPSLKQEAQAQAIDELHKQQSPFA